MLSSHTHLLHLFPAELVRDTGCLGRERGTKVKLASLCISSPHYAGSFAGFGFRHASFLSGVF